MERNQGRAAGVGMLQGRSVIVADGSRTPCLLDRCPDVAPNRPRPPAGAASAMRWRPLPPEGAASAEAAMLPMGERSWP